MLLITLTQYCYKDTVYTLKKNAGLFQPNFGSNVDKPRRWVIFFIQILTQRSGLSIFYLNLVKTTQHFLKCNPIHLGYLK